MKKFWITLSAVLLTVVSLAAAVLCGWAVKTEQDNRYTLAVSIAGEREITLEYGQSYAEEGASAQFSGTHRHTEAAAVPVVIEGAVDENIIGCYLVKYTARYGNHIGTAYRKVNIEDNQAPTITLVADPEKFTFPNETYVEEGFSAQDNYDGDITAWVERLESRERIVYIVTDTAGNRTVVERQIVYDDPIPPELTLKGAKAITLTAGQSYSEPGYTATDNCDGDISANVTVTGSVDVNTPGSYTLTYTVQDAYANVVSVKRTVQVNAKSDPQYDVNAEYEAPTQVVPNGKSIYLTFDDGPGPRTGELLDILKKYNVKATFFVVNTAYISTIERAAAEGHTIAIHSATHKFKEIYASEDAYFNDLYTMQEIIKSYTGQTATLLRFPGGSSNTVSRFNPGIMTRLTQLVHQRGFQYFDWNVDSRDAGGAKTAEEVYYNVINGIGDKQAAIVLQHDIKGFSIDAVEWIIQWGLENGYTFRALDMTSPAAHHGINN